MLLCPSIDNWLRIALAAQNDHQVRDQRRAAVGIEFNDFLCRQHIEGHFDHSDRSFDQRLACRHNGLGLLAPKHRARDFGSVSKMSESAFVHGDAGNLQSVDEFSAQL